MTPPAPVHADVEYQELQPARAVAAWRTLVGSGALLISFLVLPVVVAVPFTVVLAAKGETETQITDFLGLKHVTPGSLAYLNLALATLIPAAVLISWLLHDWQRPRWLLSVAGRIRWRWLLVCAGLSVVTLLVTTAVSAVLPSSPGDPDVSGHLHRFTSQTLGFVLVIVFLTPLQATGEEFAFRGYLTQAWGGLAARRGRRWGRVVAVLVPAFLFGLAHGIGQDLPVFFDRFAFGVVAGLLVILTGGLEAGIAMHVLNNFTAFGFALAFGSMTTALTNTHGSWWLLPTTLTQSLLYLALVRLVARRMGIAARAPEVLVGPRAAV